MTQFLIMCRSLTAAQKSARLLERSGITAVVIKAPQNLTGNGCGYSVSLRSRLREAAALLRKYQMLNGKIYESVDGGEFTEVRL